MPPTAAAAPDSFARFLLCLCAGEHRSILLSPNPILHYSLLIDFADLLESDPPLAHDLFSNPFDLLPQFDQAARISQGVVLDGSKDLGESASVKEFVHVRITVSGSPLECPETFPSIGRVRVNHRGILLTLKGTVINSGTIKMIEGEREYECRKCKLRFKVHPELETGNSIRLPSACPSRRSKSCEGVNFQLVPDNIVCRDYQEIKIQESTQVLGVGSIPRSIPVILLDDLVDIVKAGANLHVLKEIVKYEA